MGALSNRFLRAWRRSELVMLQFLSKFFRAETETLPPPMLDGSWSANDELERAKIIASADELDCVCVSGGVLHVSAGSRVYRVESEQLIAVAELPGVITALAAMKDGGLVAAVEGHGICRLGSDGQVVALTREPAVCVTALAYGPAGDVYFCQGSQNHPWNEWYQDLMRLGASGGVGVWTAAGEVRWIARGMRFPSGVALQSDGELLVSEAWAHRVVRLEPKSGVLQPVLQNLAGYPGRIAAAAGGGYWLSMFALRTLLVDFVLTEDAFRQEMIETIDPLYWVRPALSSGKSYLEPLQGGAIVKLGIRKAWSPPRSYGLVCRLSEAAAPLASFHSRVGGLNHGISAAIDHGGTLFAVSKGAGRLLAVEEIMP